MGDWAPTVGIVGLALVVGTTLVLSGPVGKALGEWIRGWSKEGQQWMALEAAKHGAVRLLAKERVADRLGPPR
jgi:hypothetical protein